MRRILFIAAAGVLLLGSAQPAGAIPAFARKYGVSCSLCHAPAPRLNAFGESFGANGFAMSKAEEARDTIDTQDPSLELLRALPLAIRMDVYAMTAIPLRKSEADLDFQTPWNIKLLTGGRVSKSISYYLYFFLGERGQVAGLEDAYLQFNDVGSSGISLIAGQFQVSDPLFKRELRLEAEDYHAYRLRVGDVRADLTYDRGVMALFSPWQGADMSLMVVNGSGIGAASERRRFDGDNLKNFAGRLSQDIGRLRLGGFGYVGTQRGAADNRMTVFGPDATLAISEKVELNAQYLHREDTHPDLSAASSKANVDSWFGEVLISPEGVNGRWHIVGLYNAIDADHPVVSLRLGEESLLEKYQTASAGVHYLLQRNVRVSGELLYDVEQERTRLSLGAFVAF